ncbi:MAG TPA: HEAT repeat domain-containing protein [Vicinamibacterales bacterium]|nr:HEAT repeat domain-containing protein [Vicinamibacterales bacterium]
MLLATSDAARGQQDPAAPTLKSLTIEAFRDEDWNVRHAAALLLGGFGTEGDADELQGLLDDERREVRGAAWYGRLMLRPQRVERAIGCIADCETWREALPFVTHLPPLVRPQHADLLTSEFARAKSPHAEYALLLLAAQVGARMSDPAVAYARMCEAPMEVFNASSLLPLLPDTPEQRERVTRWLQHKNELVRHRCAAWLLLHGVGGEHVQRHIIADHIETHIYDAEVVEAVQALGAEWIPTTRATLMDAVGKARVVLVGDLHTSKCIADLAMECCVASLKSGQPGKVAFGYEAPVETYLPPVSPRATALGLVAVPLEPAKQLPSLRARDAAANASIRAWLGESPEHKMVALYGGNHLLGRGHIDVPGAVRILTSRPAHGLLQHLRAESLANNVLAADTDRWFVHRKNRDTFFVICDDFVWHPESRPAFTAWLAARLRK